MFKVIINEANFRGNSEKSTSCKTSSVFLQKHFRQFIDTNISFANFFAKEFNVRSCLQVAKIKPVKENQTESLGNFQTVTLQNHPSSCANIFFHALFVIAKILQVVTHVIVWKINKLKLCTTHQNILVFQRFSNDAIAGKNVNKLWWFDFVYKILDHMYTGLHLQPTQ